MIIQVRGTSGSGKTTVMRAVKDAIEKFHGKPWNPVTPEGRKKPLHYWLEGEVILGHYENSACGGCDTIGSARQVYDTYEWVNQGVELEGVEFDNFLMEGLLLSEDTKWTLELSKSDQVYIAFLTTPVDECIERIKGRREKVGNEKPLNEKNTRNRVGVIERARLKLSEESGILCRRCSSEQAPSLILSWLGYTPAKGKR